MEQFYRDFGFIIGFMILCLIVLLAFGEKAERGFLLMVLLSMAVLKAEQVTDFLDTHFRVKEG